MFGLNHKQYPKLEQIKNDIDLLDKLYSLYSKVKDSIGKWHDIPWIEITQEIDKMNEAIENFGRDCMRLPGQLKQWGAYKELKAEIEKM